MVAKRSLGLLAALPLLVMAQDHTSHPQRSVVRASGEATATAKPDEAKISIGVVTQAANAEDAASRNATQVNQVLTQVKQVLGANGDVRTINYSVSPEYKYPKDGGKPTIIGYSANNMVQATINDIALVGKVIDAATQSGSNSINGIQFTLKDDQSVRRQAIREATAKAKATAEDIAAALGVKVTGVVSAETGGGGGPRPIMADAYVMKAARAEAAPTPIETGTIEVHATVTVTLAVQ